MRIRKLKTGEFTFSTEKEYRDYGRCDICGFSLDLGYVALRNKLKKFIDEPNLCCYCWIHKHHDVRIYKDKTDRQMYYEMFVDGEPTHISSVDIYNWIEKRGFRLQRGWNDI